MNAEGFRADMDALRKTTLASLGPADLDNIRRHARWSLLCTILGYATAWIAVQPFSIAVLGLGLTGRWLVAHHVAHGGYERVPGAPAHYTRDRFARGLRRFVDWFDWIEPEAWAYEHNFLHHYHTSELADPDLVHRNFGALRRWPIPRFAKVLLVLLAASAWKLLYFAPQALNGLESKKNADKAAPHQYFLAPWNFFDPRLAIVRHFWLRSVLPYSLFHFVIVPALFLPLGTHAAVAVLVNRLLAEVFTNLQTFLLVVPSHTGDDLLCFDTTPKGRSDFYLRQVLATANYMPGSDVHDFLHMGINYQIEHHLFPDLPLSAYRRMQPEVAAACRKHGIPYVEESVFRRFAKMIEVAVGPAKPRPVPSALALTETPPNG